MLSIVVDKVTSVICQGEFLNPLPECSIRNSALSLINCLDWSQDGVQYIALH